MDCRIVQQNIDLFVDGMLSETDRQQLLDHAASCVSCQKAIDDALCLKNALGSLGELEPPQGLALSAIKKAKKKKPLFAYVSVATAAVAAAIGLVVVLTSGTNMDHNSTRMAGESAVYSMSAADNGTGSAEMAPQEEADIMLDGATEEWEEREPEALMEEPKVQFSAEAYTSEDEFITAEGGSYYKPAVLPEDAALESIAVDEESIVFTYRLDNQDAFRFAWLDSLDQNGLKDWLVKGYGDLSNLDFDGTYYMAEGAETRDVYWEQDGDAFYAAVPVWFTADDIAAYCTAQFVVADTDEE